MNNVTSSMSWSSQISRIESSEGSASPFSFSSLLLCYHPIEFLLPFLQQRIYHCIVIHIFISRHVILFRVRCEFQADCSPVRKIFINPAFRCSTQLIRLLRTRIFLFESLEFGQYIIFTTLDSTFLLFLQQSLSFGII
uniref:Uncharacterized protein n=1 Tax=Opuntia streptacantha TaxID=393608 RepID=A0A7C9AD35_OPUST